MDPIDTRPISDEGWLSAQETLDLVSQRNGSAYAHEAIARRAHLGGLRSKARLFIWEKATRKNSRQPFRDIDIELPPGFWWAEGNDALEPQDWAAGDFGTWIDNKFRWLAFGVQFDLSGVNAMLAPISASPNLGSGIPEDEITVESRVFVRPSDDEIRDKMIELCGLGVTRDDAAKFIRQIRGFENVGKEHARRAVQGHLTLGRKKRQKK